MAIGDRVVIGDGSTWDEKVTVAVYQPLLESNGSMRLDHFGASSVNRAGGVKGGSTGVITGQPIKVHRMQMGEPHTPGLGNSDLINLFPIQFDYYQQLAYIRAEHIRVVSGTSFRGR